jgi:hypothetical protein
MADDREGDPMLGLSDRQRSPPSEKSIGSLVRQVASSEAAEAPIKPYAIHQKMAVKQIEALLRLAPCIDQSSTFQRGMDEKTAKKMAELIVQEKIDRMDKDSDEDVAVMLQNSIEQFTQEAKRAHSNAKSIPIPGGLSTRNAVKTQAHTVKSLAF